MLSGRFAYACLVTSRQRLSVTNSLCGATLRLARPFLGNGAPVQHFLYPQVHLPLQQQQAQTRNLATPAAMDDDVRVSLRKLLPTVDMEKTTERQIREMLAQELGTDMAPYKKVIKEAIDTWLVSGGADAADNDDNDDASQQGQAAPQASGRKRGPPTGGAAGERAAKVARSTAEGGGPPGGVQLDTQGLKWVSVSTFKGQQRVDIRNFFRDREGNLGPTKKGLSLSQSDWGALQATVPAVSQALADSNEEFVAELPYNRRVTTSVFSGKLTVGIREYYESDGQLQPGMKGINLLPDQWEALVEAVPAINTQLANGPPLAAGAAGAGAAAARQSGAAAGAAASRAGPAKAAGRGSAAAVNGAGGGGGAVEVQLGGKKRAAISMFTGTANVDLREVYEKDGQTLPGKKGIMLKPDQWRALVAAADDITSALTAHNTRYVLELGNKRRVSISEFKNVWYVGVREFYEQGGELKPGSKGLSMNREQWQKLVAGMDALTAQL